MRTKKVSSKRVATTPPEIEAVIAQVSKATEAELPALLRTLIPANAPYALPRADLHAFIPLLNRLDSLLESVITDYEIDTIQRRPFDDGKKDLVMEILRVERLVLDNTTSRKLYASYDRLQSLLFTSDLQVLHATILLLLRPAQQYSSHTPFDLSTNTIVKSRLLRLAEGGISRTWGKAKEEGWGMKELEAFARNGGGVNEGDGMDAESAGRGAGKKLEDVPEDWFNVQMSFYKPTAITDKPANTVAAGEAEDDKGPTAAELEKPTQDLRLASESGSVNGEATPTAGVGNESMNIDSPGVMETPVRPRAGAAGRARSGLAQSTSLVDMDTPAPSTPNPASKLAANAATPSRTPGQSSAGTVAINTSGSLTTSPFSRCFTNPDGHVTLSIFASGLLALVKSGEKTAMDVLVELVGHHPELLDEGVREELFELLCKLRVVLTLRPPSGETQGPDAVRQEETRMLLEIRIIALATYLHLSPEDVAQTELFLYDTSIIPQLADLTNPTNHTDDRILAAVFIALDACARYKARVSEVLTAVNANVAHGMLLAGFAALIKRLQTDEEVPHELVDAQIAFVSFAATASGYGSMLIGAGILPVLIECFKIRAVERGGYVARAIGLIDSILYGSTTAFNMFVTARGIDILNERISFEIDRFLDPIATPDDLSSHELVRRSTTLKLSLRSLHRMMQAPGTTEGLRNLIDSELPKSLKKIFENPNKVGAPSLAIAINITATFVHNEPTSLAVIQEMKLPEALYDAIEGANKASFELLSATTNAISALCLNQAGMDLTLSRPQIIKNLVDCVRNPEYRDILRERDNAVFIGSALDELARHHVPLKQLVLEATTGMLKRLLQSGLKGYSKGITMPADYKLVLVEDKGTPEGSGETSEEVQSASMEVVAAPAVTPAVEDVDATDKMQVEAELLPRKVVEAKEDIAEIREDETAPEMHFDACVELASQIMQGLFHNQGLARDFIRIDGHKLVIKLLGSPAMLAQQATTETMHAVSSILRVLAEASLGSVLHSVIKSCRKAMEVCKPLWQREDLLITSYLAPMLDIEDATTLESQNASFRRVAHLANLLGVLSTLYSVVGYGHTKVTVAFLQQVGSSQHSSLLDSLGALHRACLWENIYLKINHGPKAGLSTGPAAASTPLRDQILSPAIEATEQQASVGEALTTGQDTPSASEPSSSASTAPGSSDDTKARPVSVNYANVKYLAHRIPAFLTPFFQGLVRMLTVKRIDSAHKKEAVPTAYQLSKVLLKHLARKPSPDMIVSRAYDSVMMGLVSILLFDERGSTSTMQVFLFNSFRKQEGIAAIARNMQATIDDINVRTLVPAESRSQDQRGELNAVYNQLKNGLDLVKNVVGRKLFESPQMPLLVSKAEDKGKSDYFNPTDCLVDVRLALFDTVTTVWEAGWLAEAPLNVIKATVQAVNEITSAVPEIAAPTGPSIVAANPGVPGLPAPAAVPRPPFVLNESYHATLQEMGFTANQSRFALTRLNNNLPGATEYLLTHAHLINDPPAQAPAMVADPPAPAPVAAVVPVAAEVAPLQVVGDDVDMSSDSEAGMDDGAGT